jgi:ferredoxin--NADP+ reductase
MTYVITRLCRDCKDMGCISVCPADCILEHRPPSGTSDLPNQLFIDPVDCIDCGACVSECPWEAIFPDVDVPDALIPDVALNALVRERRAEFQVPEVERHELPTSGAVEANKERWGLGSP